MYVHPKHDISPLTFSFGILKNKLNYHSAIISLEAAKRMMDTHALAFA